MPRAREDSNNNRNKKSTSPQSKSPPPLQTDFKYQDRPRRHWLIVQEFGQKGGGCNDGVAKVEIKDDPVDRFFFEKRFSKELIGMGIAHKEIGLLNQLGDWPGVVKMVDHYIDEKKGHASVYMEYCDAGDLEKVIQTSKKENKRVHERKIWQWFIGLMDTLVYMHRGPEPENDRKVLLYWNSVYHRDIKPGNILLKTDYKEGKVIAKMADFGCSNSAHWTHMTKRGRLHDVSKASALTPGYDAPEHPEYSGATDVWQVALCIACVCTGIINPWSMQNPRGQKWDKKAPAGQYYSQKLNAILAWCLTEDKKRRPAPLEISKRAKTDFANLTLPPDNEPLSIFGSKNGQGAQSPQPVSSPRAAFGYQQPEMRDQRPGIHPHAFSDPEVQRMDHRRNPFNIPAQDQGYPMSMASLNEMMHGGMEHPPPSLPGNYMPGYGQAHFPPGFGPGGFPPGSPPDYFSGAHGFFPDPRFHQRRW